MRNLYFVQVNDIYLTDGRRNTYIPYAAGCIEAYCLQNAAFASRFRFGKIVYCRGDIDEIVSGFDDPYMVLFSCSVWNTQFSLALAEAVKRAYPACYVTIGGHHVSADVSYLERYPFVDYLIHRAGEEPAEQLLLCLAEGRTPEDVPNISFRSASGAVVTTREVPQTGVDYPSPYLTGVFDGLLQDDVTFSVLFETNRGCPNRCAFCDWGALKSKVRLFPLERVFAEIDWFAAHRLEYIYCADANFCLFDRDAQIVDYIIRSSKTCGYPKFFHVNFTKNKQDFVFEISTKMVSSGLSKAQTIAFQSLNPEVLKNVGRTNLTADHFRSLMRRFSERRIATYCELILGLPGETYRSFCEGMCSLLENGQHFAINVYPCELLPNSEMGRPEYRARFGIRGTRVPFLLMHATYAPSAQEIPEYAEFITSTASMDGTEWARALLFASCVQGFHNLGLLRATAIYCRYEFGFPYLDFYEELIREAFSGENTFLSRLIRGLYALCEGVIRGENAFVALCEGTENILWGFDELAFLNAYKDLDAFYADVNVWLKRRFGADRKTEALFRYQRDVIKRVGVSEAVIRAPYDFYSFFQSVYRNEPEPPAETPIELRIEDPVPVDSFARLARETVWYGRNRREPDYTGGRYPVEFRRPDKG